MHKARRRRIPVLAVAGLLGAGGVAGAIASAATTASASTTASTSSTPNTSSSANTATSNGSGSSSGTPPAPPSGSTPPAGRAPGLPESGTVTAIGSSSVTIKTSNATTAYAVTSTSDIDKNGEAQLSDLAVGDAVTFSTATTSTTPTIDKLHAGNEALDMPQAPPQSGAGAPPAYGSAPPAGQSASTPPSSTA